MSAWDREVFGWDVNVDFLDELAALDDEDIVAAVRDAILLAASGDASEDEQANGLAAATITAIWAGAPFSSGEIVESYPFIRELAGAEDEELNEKASELLENVEADYDLEPFIEALA